MTMVQPVITDDHLAGPAWDMCAALLGLEKLRVGEAPSDNEWASIANTAGFFTALARTPGDSISSPTAAAYLRVLREKPDLDFFNRRSGELMDLSQERSAARAPIASLQGAVLDILEIVNRCRRP